MLPRDVFRRLSASGPGPAALEWTMTQVDTWNELHGRVSKRLPALLKIGEAVPPH